MFQEFCTLHQWIMAAIGAPLDPATGLSRHDELASAHDAWLADIKRRVPPNPLLVHESREGWAPLCAFLGATDGPPPLDEVFERNLAKALRAAEEEGAVLAPSGNNTAGGGGDDGALLAKAGRARAEQKMQEARTSFRRDFGPVFGRLAWLAINNNG